MEKEKVYLEIKACLTGKFDIKLAMRIHTKYSKNYANKKRLATKPVSRKALLPTYLKELLNFYKPLNIEEPRPLNNSTEPNKNPSNPIDESENIAPSEQTKRVPIKKSIDQRLKEEFPKLKFKELPDNLKLLVLKRYDAWEESKKYHELQHIAETDKERFEAAKNTVLSIQENWQIWEELDYYHKYRKPLGKHSSFKKKTFEEEIKELEKKPVHEYTKEFGLIRQRARNNINRLLNIKKKKKKLTEPQRKLLKSWIHKFNVVSEKLELPLWKIK